MSRSHGSHGVAGRTPLLCALVGLVSCGGGGGGDDTARDEGPNQNPVFISNAAVSTPENRLFAYAAIATDANRSDTLTYSVDGGADASQFDIDARAGTLSFRNAPDFENARDSDSDNVYEVTLSVSDGRGGVASRDVTITVTDVSTLEFEVTFPTLNAEFRDSVREITVAGTVADSEDGELLSEDLQFIDVNGIMASRDLTDPSRWSAVVALPNGRTQLTALARPARGDDVEVSFSVTNQVDLPVIFTAVDPASNRTFVANSRGVIIGVDLDTGLRTVASGDGVGAGEDLRMPFVGVVDSVRRRLLVSQSRHSVYAVDLATGNRSEFSSNSLGSGPSDFSVWDMDVDPASGRVLMVDRGFDRVLGIDGGTGNRTTLSSDSVGSGQTMLNPTAIGLQGDNQALVIDWANLFSVNLANGNRTLISNQSANSGPRFGSAASVLYDEARSRAVVPLQNPPSLIAIDLASGDRTTLSGEGVGAGPDFIEPYSVEWAPSGESLIVSDRGGAIVGVNPANGDRTLVSSNLVGDGERGIIFEQIAVGGGAVFAAQDRGRNYRLVRIDPASGDRALVSSEDVGGGVPWPTQLKSISAVNSGDRVIWFAFNVISSFSIIAIDVATGERTLLSGEDRGEGPNLRDLEFGAASPDGLRAIAFDADSDAIMEFDLETGDRRVAVTASSQPEFSLQFMTALAFDAANNRALVLATSKLLAVDLETGMVTLLASDERGSGPSMGGVTLLTYDPDSQTAYAAATPHATPRVLAIDVLTGDRREVSGESTGRGPALSFFDQDAAIAIDAVHNRLYYANDDEGRSLNVLDIHSGDRAISSR